MPRSVCLAWQEWVGDKLVFSCECGGEGCPLRRSGDTPVPCWRWPTCEGYLMEDGSPDPINPSPGDCAWPACTNQPAQKGSPLP